MYPLDWLVILIPLIIILAVGIITQRQMKSVAHFVSGGRLGGRYILAVAKGEMQAGAVVFVAAWEIFAHAGFVPSWWTWLTGPVGLIVAIFGFVLYRFRETRAMTLAQFFEMRYSRNFRSFAGVLGFFAGVINFGIIPAVGARFMVYFLQLPPEIVAGSWTIPTYIPLMGIFLTINLLLTISGGLITLMVTDCLEGIFSEMMYIVIIIGILSVVTCSQMSTVIGSHPAGHSMVNPFDAGQVQDFNLAYVLIGLFLATYGTMAWQNSSAYNSAAASPHEARMSGLLGRWRESSKFSVVVLLAAAAITYLGHPDFAAASAGAKQAISEIAQPQIQTQMTIPVALSHMLPIGVKGALCAVLIMGIFGGDSTHLHSWGGILAQDIILPRLKKEPTPEQHIKLLRRCITGVAAFAFLFGVFFRQTEYIAMWFAVTTAVYVGGAGAAIIGGLYWKKGTTAGAWAAIVSGAVLSGGGILAYKLFGDAFLADALRAVFGDAIPRFNLNGVLISLFATLISIALYIGVSLATCRQDYPINKMLHRDELPLDAKGKPIVPKKPWTFARILGIDEHFSRGDKWLTIGFFTWTMIWFAIALLGTLWTVIGHSGLVSWIKPWSNSSWISFWNVAAIGLPIVITVITSIWFTWGGIRDIRALFRSLKTYKVDDADNGMVKAVASPAVAPVENQVETAPLH